MKRSFSLLIITLIAIIVSAGPVSAKETFQNRLYADSILEGLNELITGDPDKEITKEDLVETGKDLVDSGKELLQNLGDTFSKKASPDKYTQYVDKYIGLNAANVGYNSLGGDRLIALGEGYLQITYVTSDGSYVGPDEEESLKNYVITDQNIAPNTEVKLEFEKDSDGNEYSNLVAFQTYTNIDLAVKRVKTDEEGPALAVINPSPDKYTYYIRNYIGKNAATVGYESLGGNYLDGYGDAYLQLNLAADDGSYVDFTDLSVLKQYVVTGQSIEPNTEMKVEFLTDGDGQEYSNLVNSQTYDSITLYLTSVTGEEVISQVQDETDGESIVDSQGDLSTENEASGNGSGYEDIFNTYEQKLKDKTQTLLEDYKNESAGADINTKADLVMKKVEMLAELSNEGVEKMASYMFSHGDADGYEKWAGKLYDVYSEQSEILMNEYLDNAW